MKTIFARVAAGEEIQIKYRSRPAVTLTPITTGETPQRGSGKAILEALERLREASPAINPAVQRDDYDFDAEYYRHVKEKHGPHS